MKNNLLSIKENVFKEFFFKSSLNHNTDYSLISIDTKLSREAVRLNMH